MLQQLYKNLRHPRQAAMFRFLKIGNNILYGFFLSLLSAVFFSPQIVSTIVKTTKGLSFIFIPLTFIFYYIMLCAAAFFFVTVLALAVLPVKTVLRRRLNYLQLWSLTVNAITWPTLLFACINLFKELPAWSIWLYILACYLMAANLVSAIPKPRGKTAVRPGRTRPSG